MALFNKNKIPQAIYSKKEFAYIIDRECERATRYNQRLSLVVFEIVAKNENSALNRQLIRSIYKRFRNLDEIGWFNNNQIGLILPHTPAKGAWKLAEDVCELISTISQSPPFTIYSYPSENWPSGHQKKFWQHLNIFEWKNQLRTKYYLNSRFIFRTALLHEIERANRHNYKFSILLFDMKGIFAKSAINKNFIRSINTRIRNTDEVGWYDKRYLGVILPFANMGDAGKIAKSLCDSIPGKQSVPYKLYSYPDNWEYISSSINIPRSPAKERIPDTNSRQTINNDSGNSAHQPENIDVDAEQDSLESFIIEKIPLWKRISDVVFAVSGLILSLPLMIIAAMGTGISSRGSIIFKQKRTGLGGKPFVLYKFRSMVEDAEEQKYELMRFNERSGPAFKMKNDPRITPFGKFIRKWSIDELPQFFNVLKGEMSVVGPRPLPEIEEKGLEQWHRIRRTVKPGITCLWQVSSRHQHDFDKWARLDIEYVRKMSFWLDIKILFQTIPAVLSHKGAH